MSFKEKINRLPLWALALLGALLLWAAWPVRGFAGLLFVGWIPLLLIEERQAAPGPDGKPLPFFRYAYLLLVLWNTFTTWWVSLASLWGGIAAVVLNAALMLLPLVAFRRTKRALGPGLGYASLVAYWVAFEHLHLSWDLTWPWLTLGNGFAAYPSWVQWYEYTGQLGGSVWVLAVNILLYRALFASAQASPTPRSLLAPALALVVPLLWSGGLWLGFEEKGPAAEVVVVQPNIDPYNEKFPSNPRFIAYEGQMRRLLRLSDSLITPQTKFVLWPETALEQGVDEAYLSTDWRVQRLREFTAAHPGTQLITGITSFVTYPSRAVASPTVRESNGTLYDVFNTGLHVPGPLAPLATYHKSKLVPGVEKLPYPGFFSFLKPLAIDLGGTVGSYGSQARRGVFAYDASAANPKVAPVICYESIYSDFVADYVRQGGATLIGIITNDGWWGDTPGHRQHLRYAALRAIETRRDVVRAANTGISAFLNQRGEILQALPWWKEGALRGTVHLNPEATFYVRFGDWLAWLMPGLSFAFLLMTIVGRRRTPHRPL